MIKKYKTGGVMKYKINWILLIEHLKNQGFLYEYDEELSESSDSESDDD